MKIDCRFFFIFVLLVLCGLTIRTEPARADVKRPLVAIEQIKSPDGNYGYVGPAVTRMLETRLSSEGIDTFIVQNTQQGAEAESLADFLVTGTVSKTDRTFDAQIVLKDPSSSETLKSWNLKAVNLDVLAQDTSLLSVKLAETIKHAEDILNAPEESQASENAQPGEISDEFQMARLHPDKLVREQLVQDEEREKELERQKSAEERKRTEQLQAQEKKRDETDWFPLPDVYDKDSDEPPEEETAAQSDNSPSGSPEGLASEESGAPATVEWEEEKKSWFSWLWPFGGSDKSKESWEEEREKIKTQESEKERKARVVPEDKLPYPPPPEIKFNIPEPVPLDQAMAKAEKMYVQKPAEIKEKGWFSWLWPWSSEEEKASIPEKNAAEKNLQASLRDTSELQQDMDSMIQGLSNRGKKAAEGGEAAAPNSGTNARAVLQEGVDSMIQGVSKKQPQELGNQGQLRQEHVYFEPRNREEGGQEEAVGLLSPDEQGDTGQGLEQGELQARREGAESSGRAQTFNNQENTLESITAKNQDTGLQIEPQGLEKRQGSEPKESGTGSIGGQTAESAPGEQTGAAGEGPIWRWY